jgi:hypothetical protein
VFFSNVACRIVELSKENILKFVKLTVGSGSRRAKMTHKKVEKNKKISSFEVLDVLF